MSFVKWDCLGHWMCVFVRGVGSTELTALATRNLQSEMSHSMAARDKQLQALNKTMEQRLVC